MKNKKYKVSAVLIAAGILAAEVFTTGCGRKDAAADSAEIAAEASETSIESDKDTDEGDKAAAGAEEKAGETASADGTAAQIDVVEEGMEPVYGEAVKDGVYSVKVDSSSRMFQITDCQLTVKDGSMSAVMTMSGTGYAKLYMGTAEEALKAPETDDIPYVETADGVHTYEVPVEALDMGIDCSAFSKRKEKWYDRTLVFRSDSLPPEAFADGRITTVESLNLEDGSYTVEAVLEGGSGRAFVESPAALRIEEGKAFATLIWSSANYDYMKVDDVKIEWAGGEGNSTFEIPVKAFDWRMPVIADTIAMSQPHEIEYTLTFDSATIKKAE